MIVEADIIKFRSRIDSQISCLKNSAPKSRAYKATSVHCPVLASILTRSDFLNNALKAQACAASVTK